MKPLVESESLRLFEKYKKDNHLDIKFPYSSGHVHGTIITIILIYNSAFFD